MTLLLDNYDSFTYNLYQLIEASGERCRVVRNDAISLEAIANLRPDRIVLSPGPGHPLEAGLTLAVIERFSGIVPILGVCLGHQAIGHAFGGRVVRAKTLRHGKLSSLRHDGRGLFEGVANPFTATRYHSLVVEARSLPACLEVTCATEDGLIMGLRHRTLAVEGVQFHPESVATEHGRELIEGFLRLKKGAA